MCELSSTPFPFAVNFPWFKFTVQYIFCSLGLPVFLLPLLLLLISFFGHSVYAFPDNFLINPLGPSVTNLFRLHCISETTVFLVHCNKHDDLVLYFVATKEILLIMKQQKQQKVIL